MKKKIYYVLPSYNESLNLKKLLNDFKRFFAKKKITVIVIIVDDGSTDNSASIINFFIEKNKSKNFTVKMITHKKNMGLGLALKTGFEYSFSKGKYNDVIVSMDTDNSHTVSLSYKMVKNIFYKKKDILIASRYQLNSKIKGLDYWRKFLSLGAAILYKIFFPIKNIKDYTSGFRAFRLGVIKKAWKKNKNFFSEKGFSASADIILKLYIYKKEINFLEVPINLRYDLKKGDSKMKIFRTIFLNLALIIKRKFL
jgi:dolichol-phosphate mannosyltransferase